MVGPIEFLGEESARKVKHSQWGGSDGLIQPEVNPMGGPGHSLGVGHPGAASVRTSSEVAGMMRRVEQPMTVEETSVVNVDGVTVGIVRNVVADAGATPFDPVSGRLLTADLYDDGSAVGLSDLKPR